VTVSCQTRRVVRGASRQQAPVPSLYFVKLRGQERISPPEPSLNDPVDPESRASKRKQPFTNPVAETPCPRSRTRQRVSAGVQNVMSRPRHNRKPCLSRFRASQPFSLTFDVATIRPRRTRPKKLPRTRIEAKPWPSCSWRYSAPSVFATTASAGHAEAAAKTSTSMNGEQRRNFERTIALHGESFVMNL
jgi:hypothetical protein